MTYVRQGGHGVANRPKKIIASAIFLLAMAPSLAAAQQADACPGNGREVQQLRIYELNRSNKDHFHQRFRDHALRIMKRHGFDVLDIWESDSVTKVEFVYLLAWPSKETMESRWKDFLADEEWIAIKKRTASESGTMVHSVNDRALSRMAYSPACTSR